MITSPAASYVCGVAIFVSSIAGAAVAVTVSSSVSLTGVSFGSFALTVAVLSTLPASTSACVIV